MTPVVEGETVKNVKLLLIKPSLCLRLPLLIRPVPPLGSRNWALFVGDNKYFCSYLLFHTIYGLTAWPDHNDVGIILM